MNQLEKTGEKFNLNTFFQARELCIKTTHKIIAQIEVGMFEKDIKNIVENEFKKIDVHKFWHPIKIRIGTDTMKSFRELSDPQKALTENDVCFLDLGPIIENHEADYGKTFSMNPSVQLPLIDVCQKVFDLTAKQWKENNLNGQELFKYAQALAIENGFELNPLMAGHRLGDFPHKLYSSEKLFETSKIPSKNLWVLEIHIIDRANQLGAFFEDILL